jgi:hypothetical protein
MTWEAESAFAGLNAAATSIWWDVFVISRQMALA